MLFCFVISSCKIVVLFDRLKFIDLCDNRLTGLFVRLKFIDLCDNRLTGFPNPASWKSTLLKEVMVSRNSIPKVSTPLNWWLLVTQVKLSGGKFRWNSFCMNFTDSDYFLCDFHVIHPDMKFLWKNTWLWYSTFCFRS